MSSTLTTVASVTAPLMVTFTLSPALISTFAAGLVSGVVVTGAGVAAAGVFAGLFEFELSAGLGSQAESAKDNNAIARIFFIVSSVSFGSLTESVSVRV